VWITIVITIDIELHYSCQEFYICYMFTS
jgi:hypothetical protein